MCVRTHWNICVRIPELRRPQIYVSAYLNFLYVCSHVLEYMCPHTLTSRRIFVQLYMCPHTHYTVIYMSADLRTAIYVSAYTLYCCICVRTYICVSSYCNMCPHTAISLSAYLDASEGGRLYLCVYIYIYSSMRTHTHTHTHSSMRTHTPVCVCVCVYIYQDEDTYIAV